jgi:S1-C subfamily serine protease
MDNLPKNQLIMLVLLVSFVTSLVTGIVTVSLVNQAPAPFTQTINKVIEKIVPTENKQQQAALLPTPLTSEEAIVKVVKDVSSSVVSVVATKDLPVIEEYFINPFPQFFPDIQIPQYRQKGTEKKQVSSGTGFFISKDGLLFTNRHVVEDTKADYSIVMNDGRKMEAKVLARDPFQDIAILKIEGKDFVPISLGDSDSVNVGQTVIAIGNALGEFRNTVSDGIISGLHRSVTAQGSLSGPEELEELIQTTAAINPGNSGGPLLDLSGRVIGINVARAQNGENIGFALTINIAKRDISDAIEFGKIKYPYLGIRYKVIDNGIQLVSGPNEEPAVETTGPAYKAGLKENDIIVEFGGVKISTQNTFAHLLSQHRVDDKVDLKILRDGKEMIVTVTLEERPPNL